jgi:Zn-dependent protease with chaperone function
MTVYTWPAVYYDPQYQLLGTVSIVDRKIRFFTNDQKAPLLEWDEFSVTAFRKDQKIFVESSMDTTLRLEFSFKKDLLQTLENHLGLEVHRSYVHWFQKRELVVVTMCLVSFIVITFTLLLSFRFWSHAFVPLVSVEREVEYGENYFKENFYKDIIQLDAKTEGKWQQLLARLTSLKSIQGHQYKIYIVDNPEANAFTLPGGIIIFTKVLLLEAQSPEEILGVLGHELGHGQKRHVVKMVVASYAKQIAASLFMSGLLGDAILKAEEIYSLKYSQAQETEADQEAHSYLREAHVSPHGLLAFYGRRMEDDHQQIKWLSTHPLAQERITSLSSFAEYKSEEIVFSLDELKAALK